ncbi:MAG: L-threonylcarbamoyladenylate synthase [Planctomycetaceae bacterium]
MTCPVGTDVSRAAGILRDGGLVAFATETVYGLGASALDPAALARLFEVKNRPRFDPIIAHISDVTGLPQLAAEIPPVARSLAERFWPGPLTLVLRKTQITPDLLTAGLPSVAVRVPAHPLALELLRAVSFPVAAPSANLFGHVSPTTAEHVAEQLGDKIDYILDGGPCRVGLESTVLDLTGAIPVLLRPGGLPVEEIEALIGPVTIRRANSSDEAEAQLAPGMLPRHYAPRTRLVIVENIEPPEAGKRIGLLTFRPPTTNLLSDRMQEREGEALAEPTPNSPNALPSEPPPPSRGRAGVGGAFAAIEVLSPAGDLREAAANFFAALRRLDALGLDAIVAVPFPNEGLGRALNDRLQRAANSQR